MNMDDDFWIGFVLVTLAGFFIGMLIGAAGSNYLTDNAWERKCVARGAAQYVVNEAGQTEFKWMPLPDPPEDE
jgi:hypothetical protein